MKIVLMIVVLFFISCSKKGNDGNNGLNGRDGVDGVSGQNGQDGTSGLDGEAANLLEISLTVDRSQQPWSDTNKTYLDNDSLIFLPHQLNIDAITNTTTSGWLEIKVGAKTYCYQRTIGTKFYLFIYKKTNSAISACDSSNDKDLSAISNIVNAKTDDILQVIPRDSKLDGIMVEFVFQSVIIE